ncbi:MAG: hypothetical protein M1829_006076 [Trizodia sp. TS-e1964]|nr:MAG: hypothetical protein M1829_006076 [Trizodia sp. TS-e1964]
MNSTLFSPTALFLLCLAASQRACALPQSNSSGQGSKWSGFAGVQHMFTFGDSYSATGFNPKVGPQPNSGDVLSQVHWTSCGGPNWVSYLTTTYNKSPFLQYNLAVGGATVDTAIAGTYRSNVLSFRQQVEELFLPIYGSASTPAPWTGANSLFAIWIGINDIIDCQGASLNDKIDSVIAEYGILVEKLYTAGARNFLFLDVPAIELSPMVARSGQVGQAKYAQGIFYYNQKLSSMADQFAQKHCDVTAFEFDAYHLTKHVLEHPSEHPETQGLKDVTTFCPNYALVYTPDTKDPACAYALKDYMWHDQLHPTSAIHSLWAGKIADLLSK